MQQRKLQQQHPIPMPCTLAQTMHFQLRSGTVTYSTIRVLPGGDGITHLAHSLGSLAALRQTVQIERLAIRQVNCMCSLMSLPSHLIQKDWLVQYRIPAVPLAPTLSIHTTSHLAFAAVSAAPIIPTSPPPRPRGAQHPPSRQIVWPRILRSPGAAPESRAT